MIKLAKAFYRGFVGGPNFENCVHHRLILEDKLLTIDVPNSNVAAVQKPMDISFPYNSKVWFNQHKKIIYIMNTFICLLKIGCTYRQ
ncbi:hypothetical protein [Pseudoalteromonas sp. B62]|uniref:hypothetical protein n=1 Tax=Pseudoalteromonas sp. B62 TaxID=630483 RepID=UPI00301D693F